MISSLPNQLNMESDQGENRPILASIAAGDRLSEVRLMRAELARLRERVAADGAAAEQDGDSPRSQARRAREAEALLVDLSSRISEADRRLESAGRECTRLEEMLDERDGVLRAALARAHEEEEQRLELQARLDAAPTPEAVAALRDHVARTEEELGWATGALETVRGQLASTEEQVRAGTQEAARASARQAEAEECCRQAQRQADRAGAERQDLRDRLAAAQGEATQAVEALRQAVVRLAGAERALQREQEGRARDQEKLEREREGRTAAREHLRQDRGRLHGELATAAARAATDAQLIAELSTGLDELGRQLHAINGRIPPGVGGPANGPAGGPLPPLVSRPPGPPASPSAAAAPIAVDRLPAADFGPVPERWPSGPAIPVPARGPGPRPARTGGWIPQALRRMAIADPAAGGHLLLQLLPLQERAVTDFVPLDVHVPGTGHFTTGRGRGPTEPLELALSTAGRIAANVRSPRGGRDAASRVPRRLLRQMQALAAFPLTLEDLRAAGIAPAPELLFGLLAHGLDPRWTVGHRTTISFQIGGAEPSSHLLQLNDGAALSFGNRVSMDTPAALVSCPLSALAAVLLGETPAQDAACTLVGDPLPLVLVQGWVERLEAGRG